MKKYLLFACLLGFLSCTPNRARQTAYHNGHEGMYEAQAIDLDEDEDATTNQTEKGRGDGEAIDTKGLELPAPLEDRPSQMLYREGYTVSYNKALLVPNWVAWHLTAAHATGTAKRKGIEFHEDEEVPEPRATTGDYRQSGYDRGHLCPAGDNKWSRTAMDQSFLMTNICPQDPNLNRGDWNEMENQCRQWAEKYGDIYIVAGPIFFKGRHKRIGRNKVTVPEGFFKVVLCMRGEPKAIGFVYKNNAGNKPKDAYVNSVDEVERITGIDFFPSLPDKVENKVEKEQNLADW